MANRRNGCGLVVRNYNILCKPAVLYGGFIFSKRRAAVYS